MTNQEKVVERLSQFNNLSFTKKQWDIILAGCGCPKSSHFWTALKQNNMVKYTKLFTLVNIDNNSFADVLRQYLTVNRENVKKSYDKAKAKKKAQDKAKAVRAFTLYTVYGPLTTEKPERDI